MIHTTACKICRVSVAVEVDDEYAAFAATTGTDPMGLLPMVTCSRCHDLRTKRDACHDKIKHACELLLDVWHVADKRTKLETGLRPLLERITQRYAAVVAEFRRSPVVHWSPTLVDALLANPRGWQGTLERFREECRLEFKKVRQADLPVTHADP